MSTKEKYEKLMDTDAYILHGAAYFPVKMVDYGVLADGSDIIFVTPCACAVRVPGNHMMVRPQGLFRFSGVEMESGGIRVAKGTFEPLFQED